MKSPQPVNRSKARTWAVVGGVLAAAAVIGGAAPQPVIGKLGSPTPSPA